VPAAPVTRVFLARPRRPGLARRVALVTTTVATVAVLITGLVSVGLVRGAAETQARRTLDTQAGLVAQVLDTARQGRLPRVRLNSLVTLLRRQQITVLRVGPDGVLSGPLGAPTARTLPAPDLAALAAGRPVDAVRRIGDRRVFLAGRALESGGGVALVQPASAAEDVSGPVGRRVLLALLVGLVVAAVAGWVLSRRLARPLQAAAGAAHRLAAGDREVRLAPAGPAEVAEVADALNALAAALQRSEGRQREFLLSVSHELRTPLTAITGFAEALADGVADDPAAAGSVVLGEARRLDRLVSDLLDLARLRADDFRIDVAPVDLADLLTTAAQVWRVRCRSEGVPLSVELPGGPLVVPTDATRVRQLVDGLADNALRVAPPGAPIVFALRAEAPDVVIEVRDGGPGLRPEDFAVAFDRSVLHDRYRGVRRVGTGVGLALVAGLAARLGGTATSGPASEGGAAFAVRLPLAGPPGGAPPAGGYPLDTLP
jgi:two-component system OmpR family sensor kinase